ncbi:hypothetical protein SE17_10245 [Kouleothrix aurantiaca]|jgi:hypothetical protein|uniref:Nif11 domain-containing protein n=1 Tax=Kouleothrix aurantiaca TaxID=186479 RepID=A0A0P9F9J7_9CHLR|nr:hypothetical protein SE17_10245 [Kouleothrix aurantiaca]
MTTREQLYAIVGRAMSDDAFAARLQADPLGTLEAEGITLSDEEKATFNQLIEEAAQATGRESKFRAA